MKRDLIVIVMTVFCSSCANSVPLPAPISVPDWATPRYANQKLCPHPEVRLSACSEVEIPEKPWVGRWVMRCESATLTFEIDEDWVRGGLKSGSSDYPIFGTVNDQGEIDASITSSEGPLDLHGTFPSLQLSYPYARNPVFKALDGQMIRLCS